MLDKIRQLHETKLNTYFYIFSDFHIGFRDTIHQEYWIQCRNGSATLNGIQFGIFRLHRIFRLVFERYGHILIRNLSFNLIKYSVTQCKMHINRVFTDIIVFLQIIFVIFIPYAFLHIGMRAKLPISHLLPCFKFIQQQLSEDKDRTIYQFTILAFNFVIIIFQYAILQGFIGRLKDGVEEKYKKEHGNAFLKWPTLFLTGSTGMHQLHGILNDLLRATWA